MKIFRNSSFQVAFGASLISFSAIFVKSAGIDSDLAGFYRMFFGLIPLSLFFCKSICHDKIKINFTSILFPVIGGALFTGDIFFWHKSINYIGPGMATLLANFQVFSLSIIAFLFMKEKLGKNFVISLPFAVIGIFLLTSGGKVNFSGNFYIGVIFGLITSVFYAFYILSVRISRTRSGHLNPFIIMFFVTLTSCLIFGTILFTSGKSFALPNVKSLILMILYGFFSQFAAWIIISNALPKVKVSLAGLLILMQPILSYVWDVLIFHRPINLIEGGGVLIALSAIYIGSLKGTDVKTK